MAERLRSAGHLVHIHSVASQHDLPTEIGTTFDTIGLLADHVRSAVSGSLFPIVLAGNCNSCIGTIAGLDLQRLGIVWFDAHGDFKQLYDLGVRTAPVAYGLAKSELGDFAFGASPAELKRAEKAYREAARLDPTFAAPFRGLAELYSDTDDYEEAADAWRTYLKLAPDTEDRAKITRKIKTLERKAKR